MGSKRLVTSQTKSHIYQGVERRIGGCGVKAINVCKCDELFLSQNKTQGDLAIYTEKERKETAGDNNS
jgi:hypothetical protein